MLHIKDIHEGHSFNWDIVMKPSSYPVSKETIVCPQCQGGCKPHFGMIDDPIYCGSCNNTGTKPKPLNWKPEPPKELVDKIRKVVIEYWNKQQNESFELVG